MRPEFGRLRPWSHVLSQPVRMRRSSEIGVSRDKGRLKVAFGSLPVHISGRVNLLELPMTNAKPTANDDLRIFFEHDWIRGDLLSNDSDPEGSALYLRSFDGVRVDAKHGLTQETIIRGDYGTFTVRPDGHFEYELDYTLDVVKNLRAHEQLIEEIRYKISDGAGGTDVGVLTLAIDGVNEEDKYHEVLDFDDMGVTSRADNFSLPNYRGFALRERQPRSDASERFRL